jgi:NOL1/NOP2/sun family putative RNA methylase
MQTLLGAEFPSFFATYQQGPVSGLRLNTLKLSPQTWQSFNPYPVSPIPWCSSGFVLNQLKPGEQSHPTSPGKHPFHAAGLYYMQDPSAMAAAELLAPQPGERVLDLAAAPGGKSTHLAALMQNQGLLVANEIHPQRAWDLAENLERCGVRNAVVLNENPGRLAAHFGAFFDRVLLDAPCSGEGMFRKSSAARQEWKPTLVYSCALRQGEILASAARLVRPGGWLAYTTCTFAPEENEAVLDAFLAAQPEFQLVNLPFAIGFESAQRDWTVPPSPYPLEQAVRLWPHRLAGEGHFIAILCKTDADFAPPQTLKPISRRQPDDDAHRLFTSFWQHTLTSPPPETLHQFGSYLYQLVPGLPSLQGLKQLHPGWWLGTLKTGRFEPSHALALGIPASLAQRTHDLAVDDPQLLAYLRGSSLPCPGEAGWLLITVNGYPLGWGKRSGGVIKNAYPRGLRWLG